VTASASERGREPERAIDGAMRSYWAAEGGGQWLQLDLGGTRALSSLDIAWLHGDKRRETFDVELSVDGRTWAGVFSGQSSGTTRAPETFSFPPASAGTFASSGTATPRTVGTPSAKFAFARSRVEWSLWPLRRACSERGT